jgi:DNA-binding transcriptional MerR regulator/mannose-6-phosphate isomerase-like protein (cupin superfamily)
MSSGHEAGTAAPVRFKIAEAARMAGVSPSTLRLWESQGLIEPVRTESGQRLYEDAHIERLKEISWLRSGKGLNPAAIREGLGREGSGREALGYGLSERAEVEPRAKSQAPSDIGRKLRYLRREAGKTLEKVSSVTGIPVSMLSTFERTSQGLSFKALHELVASFGTTLAVLSGQEDRNTGESLIRNGEWSYWPPSSSGVTVQILSEGRNQMECHRFVLAAGASSEGAYQHDGEEFMHVLAGRIEIVLDGDQFFELGVGDSFYFESKRPHSWRNSFAGETVLVWINTPPTF